MSKIYVITETLLDSWENESSEAVTWKVIGYMTDEQKAKEFCEKGGQYKSGDCWAIRDPFYKDGCVDKYSYKELPEVGFDPVPANGITYGELMIKLHGDKQ